MDRDLGFLVDILIAARDLMEFKQGTTKEEFLRSKPIAGDWVWPGVARPVGPQTKRPQGRSEGPKARVYLARGIALGGDGDAKANVVAPVPGRVPDADPRP